MSLWHPHFHQTTSTPGFSSLFRLLDDFDKYTSGQLTGTASTFSPKFDVAEHDKEYVLQGELPGVQPDKVEIEFTDPSTLVVRGRSERSRTEGDPALLEGGGGKKGKEGERAGPKYWLSERSYGEFSRVFNFPGAVDQEHVQAKFKDGVLDIKVPKAEKKGGRKIAIQ